LCRVWAEPSTRRSRGLLETHILRPSLRQYFNEILRRTGVYGVLDCTSYRLIGDIFPTALSNAVMHNSIFGFAAKLKRKKNAA